MGTRTANPKSTQQPAVTPATDKARLEAFASSLLQLETPHISTEINEQIASVMSGAAEELQWIADELEHGGA